MAACKPWTGYITPLGYGRIMRLGRVWQVHRWVFYQHHGWLPSVVRHSCDVRHCIEITHLLPGTQLDNVQDMWRRGRESPGQRGVGSHAAHPNARLTPVDVAAIRADARPQRLVAASYGIAQSHVSRIKRGTRWK